MREAVAKGLVELRFRHRVDELTVDRRRRDRRRRQGARAERRRPRPGGVRPRRRPATSRSRAQAVVAHHRRHRRQPRAGAREVAGAARRAARADALRRPRARRRPDARDRARGGRQRDQRRPHVALRRGHPQLGPDLAHARDPDHPRPVVACGSTPAAGGCPARCIPASTRSARSPTSSTPATTTRGSCSPRRSSRRSSRCRAPSRTPTRPRKSSRAVFKERLGSGPPSPVQAFMDHGEDFIVRAQTWPTWCGGMNALTGDDLIDLADLEAPDRGPRPPAREPLRQGRPDHRDPRRPRLLRGQGHARRGAAPDPRPQGRPADRRAAVDPHPQVARRAGDRPRLRAC